MLFWFKISVHSISYRIKLVLTILTFSAVSYTESYRIQGSEDENKPFVPYEKGFVYDGNEVVPAAPTRINQGYESFIVEEGSRRIQTCPGMVGPLDDGKYYCMAKEHGYCDRRSGTCFCNEGYTGVSCEECDPNHHRIGSLCYKKVMCPNQCSSAGECDFLTGKCFCNEFREGNDCSTFKCSKYHDQCTHCNQHRCVKCTHGFSVLQENEKGSQCEPCHRFDPRCTSCNSTHCLDCTDLLLQSIHRSGRRENIDPELPPDEVQRQFGITIPFGSQQTNAFDEAEYYSVVDNDLIPLRNSSVQCDQGTHFDASFYCYPMEISNVVCGHHGVFSFLKPVYAVSENVVHLRITVHRSGGGGGAAEVSYGIAHISTQDDDVTPTAFYSTSQVLKFSKHEIRKSFLLTIHDDKKVEGDETFQLFLYNPSEKSQLGNQWRSIVTILDDDQSGECNIRNDQIEIDSNSLTIHGLSPQCHKRSNDEKLLIVAKNKQNYNIVTFMATSNPFLTKTSFALDGQYKAGEYLSQISRIVSGGLRGTYFKDLLLENKEKARIDSIVNFTWSEKLVQSVRWDGMLARPKNSTECCTFFIEAKNVRLWINRYLIINEWSIESEEELLLSGYYDFQSDEDMVEIMLEVRHTNYTSSVKLMWIGNGMKGDIIPSSNLFWKDNIAILEHSISPEEINV